MLEKMIFQSQEEEVDFEKYRQLKGDDLYFQIFRILSEKTQYNPHNIQNITRNKKYIFIIIQVQRTAREKGKCKNKNGKETGGKENV